MILKPKFIHVENTNVTEFNFDKRTLLIGARQGHCPLCCPFRPNHVSNLGPTGFGRVPTRAVSTPYDRSGASGYLHPKTARAVNEETVTSELLSRRRFTRNES